MIDDVEVGNKIFANNGMLVLRVIKRAKKASTPKFCLVANSRLTKESMFLE